MSYPSNLPLGSSGGNHFNKTYVVPWASMCKSRTDSGTEMDIRYVLVNKKTKFSLKVFNLSGYSDNDDNMYLAVFKIPQSFRQYLSSWVL